MDKKNLKEQAIQEVIALKLAYKQKKGPLPLKRVPYPSKFTDAAFPILENAHLLWHLEELSAPTKEIFMSYLYEQKDEHILRGKKFLSRNGISIDIEKHNYNQLMEFISQNAGVWHPDSPELDDFWTSIVIDVTLYMWDEQVKKEPALSWGGLGKDARPGYNRILNEIVIYNELAGNNPYQEFLLPLNSMKIWVLYFTSPYLYHWYVEPLAETLTPDFLKGRLETFYGPYSSALPPRIRKPSFRDDQYAISDLLFPLVNPPDPDLSFNEVIMAPPIKAEDSVIKTARTILKKDSNFITSRIEEFNRFLTRHSLIIDVENDNYEQLDAFITDNIEPTHIEKYACSQPSDFWLSISIDLALYIVHEKQKKHPELDWRVVSSKGNIGVLDLINRNKKRSSPFLYLFISRYARSLLDWRIGAPSIRSEVKQLIQQGILRIRYNHYLDYDNKDHKDTTIVYLD